MSNNNQNSLFSLQIYTPGSDIAVGSQPNQTIIGRTGNDFVFAYQPLTTTADQRRIDVLLGDVAVDDIPEFRQWNDTFALGDWRQSYYANNTNNITDPLGLETTAYITDFNPALDTIQLFGSADNYQLLDTGLGTTILQQQETGLDVVGFVLGNSNLNLGSNYFKFQGVTPPPGPAVPQAQQLGTSGYDLPLSTASDPFGNVYVAGATTGSLGGTNAGFRDALVAKYDNQGNQVFLQQFGTSHPDTIYGIGTDNQGNYYVGGITEGNLGGTKQADIVDTFVAKYDSNGNQQWIQQIGENVIFNAFDLAVDKNTGDVVITGVDVRNDIQNTDDAFVIKFDTNGNKQWQTETGTTTSANLGIAAFDEAYGVTVSNDGSIYATGWTVGNLGGPNQGKYDNWIAKYDNTTGEEQWVRQYGTSDYEWSWDVQTDSQGNLYTTGWTLGSLEGENAGSYDAYLTKYDSNGNQLWIKQFGGVGDDEAFDLFIDENDNIFLTGYTNGNLEGINNGLFDAWVALFDTEGNQQWLQQFGTSDVDQAYGITGDNAGNVFVTGVTQGSLGGTNEGSFDTWVAKLNAATGVLENFNGSPETVQALFARSSSPLESFDLEEINTNSPQLAKFQKLTQSQEEEIANYFEQFTRNTLQLPPGSGGPDGTNLARLIPNPNPYIPPASVPEPSSAVGLLMFGAMSTIGARKVKGRLSTISTSSSTFQGILDKSHRIENRLKTKVETLKQRVVDKGHNIESRFKNKASKAKGYATKVKLWCKQVLV
ncbi:hypothetical protein NUACC21_73640 [Scytonema sp. NUACC21]